jgi:AcrR family transcriptional regulator
MYHHQMNYRGCPVDSAETPDPGRKRTGRRAGPTVSNQHILEIARRQFGDRGFEGTTMRTIAQEAGVDTALIHHFFLTKEGLFEAAVGDVLRPPGLVAHVTDGPAAGTGERVLRRLVPFWDEDEQRVRLVALLRSATTTDLAAAEVRAFLGGAVFRPVAVALGVTDPARRGALAGAYVLGLAVMRYLFRIPPVADLPVDELAPTAGATVQLYLTGSR